MTAWATARTPTANWSTTRSATSARAYFVASDEGFGADTDEELYASDAGVDGGAASAEEAAVHVIDPSRRW